jgi:hypothetical protein
MLPLGHIMIEIMSMIVSRDSKMSPKKYNTCILFIPSGVTVEEGKIP